MTTRRNPIAGSLRAVAMICFLAVLAVGNANAQQTTPTQVERQIVGTYELAEWHFEGQVLKPPAVNGGLVFHNVAVDLRRFLPQFIRLMRREKVWIVSACLFAHSLFGVLKA
jgi:hypothetical protein